MCIRKQSYDSPTLYLGRELKNFVGGARIFESFKNDPESFLAELHRRYVILSGGQPLTHAKRI